VSVDFARLREAFDPNRDAEAAFLCTFGLDAPFFESEILPALVPSGLPLDPQAGSRGAYLHAADEVLGPTPVEVLYDHMVSAGPQLLANYRRVVAGTGAFHPKLVLVDYGNRIRAVVSSANLTRPAWTSLFELLVVEDLVPGTPHPWSAPLQRFVSSAAEAAGGPTRCTEAILRKLVVVPHTGPEALHSSYDSPLRESTWPTGPVDRIDVVSPFFEGEDGTGVFDALHQRYPGARLRLHLAATQTDTGYEVHGPAEKLEGLRSGGAELRLVRPKWESDDDAAPVRRALHGKLTAFTKGDKSQVVIGSANFTRAALSKRVTHGGNTELVATVKTSKRILEATLPPSFATEDRLAFVSSDPSEEDTNGDAGADHFVLSASYSGRHARIELELAPNAPPLEVAYEGKAIGTATDRTWEAGLDRLGADTFVTVDAGEGPAIVPLEVVDPESLEPRGTPLRLDLESFCDLLSGRREPMFAVGDGLAPSAGAPISGQDGAGLYAGGAIPWRRILAGIAGLRDDLFRQLARPQAVAWTIDNPTRLAGLRSRLGEAHDRGVLKDGDQAFALFELTHALGAVRDAAADHTESLSLIRAAEASIETDLERLLAGADPDIARQLQLLRETEDGA